MKKAAVFLLLASIFTSQSFAAYQPTVVSHYSLPYQVAQFHREALDAKASIYDAKTAYFDAVSTAEDIDTVGKYVINNKTGEESYETFDDLTALEMTLKKYLLPIEKGNLVTLATMNHEALVNGLEKNATSAFQDLVFADLKVTSTEIGLKMAQIGFEAWEKQFEQGKLTALEFGFERYKLMAAEVAFENAVLAFENAQRLLNLSVGFDIMTDSYRIAPKLYAPIEPEPLEVYVQRALEERLSLNALKLQISETELEIELIQNSEAYDWHLDTQAQVVKLERDLEVLQLTYALELTEVTSEVRAAYEALTIQVEKMEALEPYVESTYVNYTALNDQHMNGEISDYAFLEAELKYLTMKQSLTAAEMKSLQLSTELLNISGVGYLK